MPTRQTDVEIVLFTYRELRRFTSWDASADRGSLARGAFVAPQAGQRPESLLASAESIDLLGRGGPGVLPWRGLPGYPVSPILSPLSQKGLLKMH